MRWFWVDRFVEFQRGSHAVGIKCVSLSEEPLDEYVPGFPYLPPPLIIEGLAQTGGIVVGEWSHFEERVVLAKVGKAVFHDLALPGDTLTYRARLDRIDKSGAFVVGTSHIGGQLQAEVELFFAHLDERVPGDVNWDREDLLMMARIMGVYDVAVDENGQPLPPPPAYLAAEEKANASGAM